MADSNQDLGKFDSAAYWNQFPKEEKIERTAETAGVYCAKDGCNVTKGISFKKPLCYSHWKEFDAFEISECTRCHWFDTLVGEFTDEDLCWECVAREQRKYPPTIVYPHGPVEHHVRYLYILKLDGGAYYAGQTNTLEIRLREHQDGSTRPTRGKHPKLVWFEEWVGQRDELNHREDELTHIALKRPRQIRRIIEEWQKPLRLVDLGA